MDDKRRGDTWIFDLPLTQPGGTTPFNLTGATVRVTFKKNKGLANDAAGVFQYSWISGGASNGITVAAPATGAVVVRVPPSDTAQFLKGTYYYDAEITDANGDVWTPDSGQFKVIEDVTLLVP